MYGKKLKTTLLATAAAVAMGLSATSASALSVLDAWQIDLTGANGVAFTVDRGDLGVAGAATAFSGLGTRTNIDHVVLQGTSTVTQTVAGGSPIGQPFTDSGFLALTTSVPEGGGIGAFLPLGDAMGLYFEFVGLTGVFNADSTITFDAGSGSIRLVLDSDTDGDSSTGDILELATFDIIDPSGGSDVNFLGGANPTGTIDITLLQTSEFGATPLVSSIFKDSSGNGLSINDPFNLHLGNVNALIDDNFDPNPDNSGVDGDGNGDAIIYVQNGGQYNVTTVSEPGTLAALGLGLLVLGGMTARRRRR